jgi:hypothetical protein
MPNENSLLLKIIYVKLTDNVVMDYFDVSLLYFVKIFFEYQNHESFGIGILRLFYCTM